MHAPVGMCEEDVMWCERMPSRVAELALPVQDEDERRQARDGEDRWMVWQTTWESNS